MTLPELELETDSISLPQSCKFFEIYSATCETAGRVEKLERFGDPCSLGSAITLEM
jgi:hypothetical protein